MSLTTTGWDNEKIRRAAAHYNAHATEGRWKSHCDPTLTFWRPQLIDLLALWDEKAKDGVPARSNFDARSLKSVLSNMLIIERTANEGDRRWRFRYWGSELVKLMGEFTNQALEDALPADAAARWSLLYDCVVEMPAPVRVITSYPIAKLEYSEGEGLIVPLTDDKGEINLVLSATYVKPKLQP
jgi:hypothetical protein